MSKPIEWQCVKSWLRALWRNPDLAMCEVMVEEAERCQAGVDQLVIILDAQADGDVGRLSYGQRTLTWADRRRSRSPLNAQAACLSFSG